MIPAHDLDATDRAIVRGLLFRRWPFPQLASEMLDDQLRDIAVRTHRLEPYVERFRLKLDASRLTMRDELLASLTVALAGA